MCLAYALALAQPSPLTSLACCVYVCAVYAEPKPIALAYECCASVASCVCREPALCPVVPFRCGGVLRFPSFANAVTKVIPNYEKFSNKNT